MTTAEEIPMNSIAAFFREQKATAIAVFGTVWTLFEDHYGAITAVITIAFTVWQWWVKARQEKLRQQAMEKLHATLQRDMAQMDDML
jgi:hypothetical protein